LDAPIPSTAIAHEGYRAAFLEIVASLGIELVMVSSLIGHSLDVLGSGLPTFFVCHDFYPFCPALFISFEGVCHSCSEERLTRCTAQNPHNRNFLNVPSSYWPVLRRAFAEIVAKQECLLIAPSKSVQVHYRELVPEFAERFVVVPHGTRAISTQPLRLSFDPGPRLRVVVLGALAPHKGSALLQEAMPGLLEFADLFLVGCGAEYAAPFEGIAGVTVIPQYRRTELAGILEGIGPHVGLLLSVYPETFSFTLQELFELAIPALCTELGSFADRIEAGVNGFLCAPEALEIVRRLRDLDRDRAPLSRVHARLRNAPRRSARDMLEDYHSLAPLPEFSARAYFAPLARRQPEEARTRCQIFWRMRETDFAEAQSSTDHFTADQREHSLRLAIPSFEEEPFEFRFDPADRAGAMIVHRLVVKSQRGDVLWTLNGDTGGIRKFEMEFLPGPDDGSAGVLHFSSNDPRFILPLDREVCRCLRDGGLVEIDCVWFPGDHARLALAWVRAVFQARSSQQHHESQAAALRTELERVRGEWENCRRRIEAMEQSAAEPSETPTPSDSRICPDGPQAGSEAG
jgi:glycosyltransferase involved in cell wall biosynthesis